MQKKRCNKKQVGCKPRAILPSSETDPFMEIYVIYGKNSTLCSFLTPIKFLTQFYRPNVFFDQNFY